MMELSSIFAFVWSIPPGIPVDYSFLREIPPFVQLLSGISFPLTRFPPAFWSPLWLPVLLPLPLLPTLRSVFFLPLLVYGTLLSEGLLPALLWNSLTLLFPFFVVFGRILPVGGSLLQMTEVCWDEVLLMLSWRFMVSSRFFFDLCLNSDSLWLSATDCLIRLLSLSDPAPEVFLLSFFTASWLILW